MYVFIAGTDRTANIIRNSIRIDDEMQERINSASFIFQGGTVPTQGQEVRMYEGFLITAATVNSVTLEKDFEEGQANGLFRIADEVWVAVGLGDEEKGIVASVSEATDGNIKLTFTANFANMPAVGEIAGRKRFAGTILDLADSNISLLENIEYRIKAVDFTRIFDKKLFNDSFTNRDSRYIVNDQCNTFANLNTDIDEMNYTTNGALQAVWAQAGDGSSRLTDAMEFREGDFSGKFGWVFAGGTATFTGTITTRNIVGLVGAASGAPTKGVLGIWLRSVPFTSITSIQIRLGSSAANYARWNVTLGDSEWQFQNELLFEDAIIVGTPVWSAVTYVAIVVTETASGNLNVDGIRVLEKEFFKHYPFVESSATFDAFNIPRVKPTETLQRIADQISWFWYIDYDRFIHLFPEETNTAPFDLDETSDNFDDLAITYDISRLTNRQVVKGGEETSVSLYYQVVPGGGVVREFLTKNKFKNLVVKVDNNTLTDTCEPGTTTTTINATAHGVLVNDYIINRSEGNAVRQVRTVPNANQFTVDAVTGQNVSDTFSKFAIRTVGIEGIDDESLFDYMSNFNEKSIRNASTEATLRNGDFIQFIYNEVFPILIQRTENASVSNMQTILGHTDGIFDGQTIVDRTLKTRTEARAVANAVLNKFANVVITAQFTTTQEGLRAGQLIHIKDTTSSSRNIDQDFLIQKVSMKQKTWGENEYSVTCSSLLFGMMELLGQMLRIGRKIQVEENEIIDNVEEVSEIIVVTDTVTIESENNQAETITVTDTITEQSVFTPPFKWEPTALSVTRWNLAQWS